MSRTAKADAIGPDATGLPPYRVAKTADLVPYANNSRAHSEWSINKLMESIKAFGFTSPVLVDGKRGILAGHARVMAAQRLGMETVPTIELSHLTPAQRRAYVIADNRTALDATWNDEVLRLEMQALRDDGFDLSLTSFGAVELATLFGEDGHVTDAASEWRGMPEFDQPDATAFRSIIVHFASQDDVDAFARLVGQKISDKAKFIWHPQAERGTYIDKRYSSAAP